MTASICLLIETHASPDGRGVDMILAVRPEAELGVKDQAVTLSVGGCEVALPVYLHMVE